MDSENTIVDTVIAHYPEVQAIYLFGSYGTGQQGPHSDADIALLLPPREAKACPPLMLSNLRFKLESILGRDVDLINLRRVSTVLQKEIVMADRRIFTADRYAADEFEMLTLSYYQKLNQERAGIVEEGLRSGRFYNP